MKSKIYTYIIITLSIVSIFGCGNKQNIIYINTNDKGQIEFDLTKALESEASVYLDDIIDSIKIIPLETTSQSLVSEILNIHVSTRNIYVNDFSNITIFNHQGKFVKQLDKGPGPKEIGSPRAMSYDEKNNLLYVFDDTQNKIVKFDSEGNFISSNTLEQYIPLRDIAVSDSLLLIAQHGKNNNFAFSTGDTTGKIYNTNVFGTDQYYFLFRKYIMPYDEGFNIKKLLDDNIYYHKDTTTKAKYTLIYPKANIDYSRFTRKSEMELAIKEGEYLFSGEYQETHDYLFTIFNAKNYKIKTVFTNKKTGESVCTAQKSKSITNTMAIESTYSNGKNWFVGIIQPEYLTSADIPEEYRWDGSNPNNLIPDEDMTKLHAVKPNDNPIIVLFKLKSDL